MLPNIVVHSFIFPRDLTEQFKLSTQSNLPDWKTTLSVPNFSCDNISPSKISLPFLSYKPVYCPTDSGSTR